MAFLSRRSFIIGAGALLVVGSGMGLGLGALSNMPVSSKALDGLPAWITYDIVEECIRCQEEYGHPAGCTLAQMIAESGGGDTPSTLASQNHNLFGIKYYSPYADEPEIAGSNVKGTYEEDDSGNPYPEDATWFSFTSDVACVTFRSRVFLQGRSYRENSKIKEAIEKHDSDLMAEGLEIWATSHTYVQTLKSVMDSFDLRKFDTMSLADLANLVSSSSGYTGEHGEDYKMASSKQKRLIDWAYDVTNDNAAYWCSGWVGDCFDHCGFLWERGHADAVTKHWCHSQNRDELKVGMIIGTWSYPDPSGYGYHVAIYAGDDKVISPEATFLGPPLGHRVERTLDNFISIYGGGVGVYWGWACNIDLSK